MGVAEGGKGHRNRARSSVERRKTIDRQQGSPRRTGGWRPFAKKKEKLQRGRGVRGGPEEKNMRQKAKKAYARAKKKTLPPGPVE